MVLYFISVVKNFSLVVNFLFQGVIHYVNLATIKKIQFSSNDLQFMVGKKPLKIYTATKMFTYLCKYKNKLCSFGRGNTGMNAN